MTMTERGTIQAGRIVFPTPLDLPEGTEVIVRIEVMAGSKPGAGGKEPPSMSDESLKQYAREHPAPAEWWDATDNPFEP
jgi:hypothetical protein